MSDALRAAANGLLEAARARKLKIATAESCTGGLVAAALTDIPGSSDVVDCGFVTYSNEAKRRMLSVSPAILKKFGAVSQETAEAMALGALRRSEAEIVVAITGIAGPGGGSPGKPVGLVHFATAASVGLGGFTHVEKRYGNIGRARVRHKSVLQALAMLRELVEQN